MEYSDVLTDAWDSLKSRIPFLVGRKGTWYTLSSHVLNICVYSLVWKLGVVICRLTTCKMQLSGLKNTFQGISTCAECASGSSPLPSLTNEGNLSSRPVQEVRVNSSIVSAVKGLVLFHCGWDHVGSLDNNCSVKTKWQTIKRWHHAREDVGTLKALHGVFIKLLLVRNPRVHDASIFIYMTPTSCQQCITPRCKI